MGKVKRRDVVTWSSLDLSADRQASIWHRYIVKSSRWKIVKGYWVKLKIKNFPVITRSDSDEVISRDSRLTRPDETSGLAMAKKGFAIIGSKNKDVQVKMYRLRAYRTVG